MSIVERLFPASELEALRATPYDFDLEPTPKRRKLSGSPCEIIPNTRRSSNDSGYDSDESSAVPEPWLASRKRSRSSISTSSSQASSPAPLQNQFTQSALFHKYLSTLPPTDPTKSRLRTQSDPSHITPDNLKDFYHQITLARSRQRTSISSLPTPPYSNGGGSHSSPSASTSSTQVNDETHSHSCVHDVGQGWTAGPKSAKAAHLSARIFDGVRITSHERSMLSSLIPDAIPTTTWGRQPMPTLSYPQRRATQLEGPAPTRSPFAGIAIGAYDDDEDEFTSEELDVDGYNLEGEGTGKVEDFFNIEEASDDSSSAYIKTEGHSPVSVKEGP